MNFAPPTSATYEEHIQQFTVAEITKWNGGAVWVAFNAWRYRGIEGIAWKSEGWGSHLVWKYFQENACRWLMHKLPIFHIKVLSTQSTFCLNLNYGSMAIQNVDRNSDIGAATETLRTPSLNKWEPAGICLVPNQQWRLRSFWYDIHIRAGD